MNKRLISMLLVLALAAALLPQFTLAAAAAETSGTCGDDLTWSFDEAAGTLTVTGSGAMTDWSAGGSAPWSAFAGSIRSVSLPEGLTSIGGYAFHGCGSLTGAEIPESVTSIGRAAFGECGSLTSVTVLNDRCALYSDSSVLGVPGTTAVCGYDGSTAQVYAREYGYAFTTLERPGDGRVEGACGEGLTWRFDRGTGTLTIAGSGPMANYSSNNAAPWDHLRDEIVAAVIEEGVTSIGNTAFAYCGSLERITVPDSVTAIGRYAFYRCYSLAHVRIPEGVPAIGIYTFCECRSLTEIELPDTVRDIAERAFYACTSLQRVRLPAGLTYIGDYLFTACYKLTDIPFPDTIRSVGSHAFSGCQCLTGLTLPESLVVIGESAFSGCTALTAVTIPRSVQYIRQDAFAYCRNLTKLVVLSYQCSIAYDADTLGVSDVTTIYGHSGSTAQTIANWFGFRFTTEFWSFDEETGTLELFYASWMPDWRTTTSLPPWHNRYRDKITGVSFTKTVSNIGNSAFCDCSALTSIAIPDRVYSIGSYAFYRCESLEQVELPRTMTRLAEGVFYLCRSLRSIAIPEGVIDIGALAFSGCLSLTDVTIPNTVRDIGNSAFANCGELERLDLPDSVTGIGDYAFNSCHALRSVEIPAGVNSIGEYAFYGCENLTRITILNPQCEIVSDKALGIPGTATVYGYPGSTAQAYAETFGYDFVALEVPPSYRVDYDANGGTDAPAAQEKAEGETLTLSGAIPARTSTVSFDANGGSVVPATKTLRWTFLSWNTASGGGGTAYSPGAQYAADAGLTLYAQWTAPAAGELPTPRRQDHIFDGWYTAAEGGSPVADQTAVTGDMTVYAHWSVIPPPETAGSCGANLTWRFDADTGTLYIAGSGVMDSWDEAAQVPWSPYAEQITGLSLPEGLTDVGAYAFCSCAGLTDVTVGARVTSIGPYAFSGCTALKKLTVRNPACSVSLEPTTLGDRNTTVIWCRRGSDAENYAKLWGYAFKPLFADVTAGAYYADPIAWAVDNAVTNGTSETAFSPEATCTRAQVVTFLWRAKGCPKPAKTDNPFNDVKPGAYYYDAVLWALEKGITNGVSATSFGPEKGCTRGQVVTFLWRAEGQPEPARTDNPFTDVKPGAYYYKAVLWAVEKGITNGTSANKFSPDATCTRAQIVTFLYRDLA